MVSRCWYLILLAGINFSNVYMMADKRGGRIIVGVYNAKWSSDQLIKFQKCICNDENQICVVDVNWLFGEHRVEGIRQGKISSERTEHMKKYVCDYNNNVYFHIYCRRQTLSDSTATNNDNPYSVQCQGHCMDVIMQDMKFNFDDQATVLKGGLCLALVLPTQMTAELIPTTEEFENMDNKTSEARIADDKKDDHTSLMTGVVIGTAAAVVIAVSAVVALLWRKGCRDPESKSLPNHVSSHEAIPLQELPSDTVSYRDVDNPVYGFQETTNLENTSDMNIYYLPDSPVENNTSSKRVDGYTDNNGPSYTYVDKVNMRRISNKENGAGNDISSYVNSVADSRDNTQGSNKEDAYSFADIPETTKNTVYTHLGERTMEKTNPYDALGQTESMTVRGQSNDYENDNVVSHMST